MHINRISPAAGDRWLPKLAAVVDESSAARSDDWLQLELLPGGLPHIQPRRIWSEGLDSSKLNRRLFRSDVKEGCGKDQDAGDGKSRELAEAFRQTAFCLHQAEQAKGDHPCGDTQIATS